MERCRGSRMGSGGGGGGGWWWGDHGHTKLKLSLTDP